MEPLQTPTARVSSRVLKKLSARLLDLKHISVADRRLCIPAATLLGERLARVSETSLEVTRSAVRTCVEQAVADAALPSNATGPSDHEQSRLREIILRILIQQTETFLAGAVREGPSSDSMAADPFLTDAFSCSLPPSRLTSDERPERRHAALTFYQKHPHLASSEKARERGIGWVSGKIGFLDDPNISPAHACPAVDARKELPSSAGESFLGQQAWSHRAAAGQ